MFDMENKSEWHETNHKSALPLLETPDEKIVGFDQILE